MIADNLAGLHAHLYSRQPISTVRNRACVVVAGADRDAMKVAAYSLDTLLKMRETEYSASAAFGAKIRAVADDWGLITDVNGGLGSGGAEAWNCRTGVGKLLGDQVKTWALGIADQGWVLRGIENGSKQSGTNTTKVCFNLTDPDVADGSGYCAKLVPDGAPGWMEMSPDGQWLALPDGWNPGHTTEVVRTSDLQHGVFHAKAMDTAARGEIQFWLSNTAFVVRRGISHSFKCDVDGTCTALATEDDLIVPVLTWN